MEYFFKYLGNIADAWIRIEQKIGLKKIVSYVLFGLSVAFILNFKSVVKNGIELVTELSEEIHNDKMEKRDQLLGELYPILVDYRSSVGADRLLYFEYHNSKQNLVGIPFKYIDLVSQSTRYGVLPSPENALKDINIGAITNLYESLKRGGGVIYCNGEDDSTFLGKFPGTYELFSHADGSKKLAFVSIPGISQPIGLIIFEWVNDDAPDIDQVKVNKITNTYISGINALILSKR